MTVHNPTNHLPLTSHLAEFTHPPREFSLLPFWFWNDDLQEDEIVRQLDDFVAHGVYGFVLHPRVGLPHSIGWMSERMLHFMRFAVAEAARREMQVVLYDEGMYPSGSSNGQVVAENPLYACRGLVRQPIKPGETPALEQGQTVVAVQQGRDGARYAIIDRPIRSVIRGLHYIGEGPQEQEPPAADLLNPDAVACFIRLVYDRYAENLQPYFGKTIIGIFTDEPGLLGRTLERDVQPGTTGILPHVNRFLGYDFTPHLLSLWDDDEPDAKRYRADYERAVHHRLEETYYQPLAQWCTEHGIALMGHPAQPTDIGVERYFHVPGQDLVWRYVVPDDASALEGAQSTQAKCSSSAMLHLGRRRNSNECFGAYGHELTFEETKWLIDWCIVRGVNMFMPHAFYYSIRGPRRDERPPDVGPNSPWWDSYAEFAAYCQRLCWLNTDSHHVVSIAILGEADFLPWSAAKVCFEHQRDFNYLEMRDLWETARITADGILIEDMNYNALIIDGLASLPAAARQALAPLFESGRVVVWNPEGNAPTLKNAVETRLPATLIAALDRLAPPDITVTPACPGLRYRHVRKGGLDFYLLFNEGRESLDFVLRTGVDGKHWWLNPLTGHIAEEADSQAIELQPHALKVLCIESGARGH